MIQTYKNPTTGAIMTEDGKQVPNLEEYGRRVRAGEISGQPKDISLMPTTIRTSGGGIGTLTSNLSGLDKLGSNQNFLQAAKDIIQRKSTIQQPLSEAKTYWRTLQRDTSPFGGMKDPALQQPGMITDEKLRLLSPADQASVIASRDSAASANLQGISDEEKYRQTREEDIMKSMTDLLTEKDKMAQDAIDAESKKLDIIKKKTDLGMPITDADYKAAGLDATGGKIGGTISWRYNNPGNIKWGAFAESHGATKGAAATDGGFFAVFPDLTSGEKARHDLLLTSGYTNLDQNTAMLRWSGGLTNGKPNGKGYTYDKLVQLGAPAVSKPFSSFSTDEWAQLEAAWKQAEGWKEGTTLGAPTNKHVFWTEASIRTLAESLGKTPTELSNNYTDDQLSQMAADNSDSVVENTVKKIASASLLRIGLTVADTKELLTLKAQGTKDSEIKTLMTSLNLDPLKLDELNKLLNKLESGTIFDSMIPKDLPNLTNPE